MIKYEETELKGAYIITPDRYYDERGYFAETYHTKEFEELIPNCQWIQENESQSSRGVLRGLHLQTGIYSQAKLVRCVSGHIIDILVDIRKGSPTFGQYKMVDLSEDNGLQIYIPRHFAHGFIVLSEKACFQYKVDNVYHPQSECCIKYDDPTIDIDWRKTGLDTNEFLLSEKDLKGISVTNYIEQYIKS